MSHEYFLPARISSVVRVAVSVFCALTIAAIAWCEETPDKGQKSSRLLPTHAPFAEPSLNEVGLTLKPGQSSPQTSGLLTRYRMALEKESRRRFDRDQGMFISQAEDEDGNPVKHTRTEAKRIFGGATGRLLSEFAEVLVQDAVALQTAKNYVQGIRFDVMSGGNVRFKAGADEGGPRAQDE